MRSSTFVAALFASSALASPVLAQQYSPPAIPPIRQTVDGNGVDVVSGSLLAGVHSISIGPPGAAGMSWSRIMTGGIDYRDSTAIVLSVSGSTYTVSVGGASESFTLSGGNYVSNQKTGSTLSVSGTTYTYTASDGTRYTFNPYTGQKKQYGGTYRVSTLTYPTGEKLTFDWEIVDGICVWNEKYMFCTRYNGERLRSVTSTSGYKLQFTFQIEDPASVQGPTPGWAAISTVSAQNMSVDPASQSWPTLTFTGAAPWTSTMSVADSLGRTTTYTYSGSFFGFYPTLVAVKRAGATTNSESIGWNASSMVSGVTRNGVSSTYSYSDLGSVRTTTVTDAASHTRVVKSDLTTALVSSDRDEAGKTTSYTYYSGSGLLNTVTAPEGNSAAFVYDGRGNLTQTTLNPKPGSALSPIVTHASYPASDPVKTWQCASATPAVTCNKPITTTDPKGYVTNYTWDSSTGALTKVRRPAPATGAVRPEIRYSYSSVYAQYLSGGSLVNFPTPVTRLTGISQCQTTASCTGALDEAKTTIAYGTANALPVSVSKGSGNGSLTATNAFTWDTVGNRLTVDGPLSGAADTTRTRYDLDREVVGVVGPDPDGGGSLENRAVRLTYNADGQVTRTELGTVDGQSDPDWANFASLEEMDTAYDSNARAVTQSLKSGGTIYALTQASYDNMGRLDCSAVRMNPAVTYDPLGRLWEFAAGTGATRYAYEGTEALTQQSETGIYWRRYVHGPTVNEPIVQYQDQGAVTRRFLATDERGSVIAMSDDSGNVTAINRYDEYGIADAANVSGFGYAGQRTTFPALNNDQARFYQPGTGTFAEPDPIRYSGDGPNLYAYVLNDPVNAWTRSA